MFYGNKKIKGVNYGGIPIKKAYYGSQLVWEKKRTEPFDYGWWWGHPYVDLGLPSGKLWALHNYDVILTLQRYDHVNAIQDLSKLPDPYKINNVYTRYYQWGRTSFTNSPTTDNCPTWQQQVEEFSGNVRFDIVASKWGHGWCMPTYEDFLELINHCTAYVMYDTIVGPADVPVYHKTWAAFESKSKNTRLILPACGYSQGPVVVDDNYDLVLGPQPNSGYYWTSTPASDSSNENAFRLYFDADSALEGISFTNIGTGSRALGRSIRAVLDRSALV